MKTQTHTHNWHDTGNVPENLQSYDSTFLLWITLIHLNGVILLNLSGGILLLVLPFMFLYSMILLWTSKEASDIFYQSQQRHISALRLGLWWNIGGIISPLHFGFLCSINIELSRSTRFYYLPQAQSKNRL